MAPKKAPEIMYCENRFCAGCGHSIFDRILGEVLTEMDIVGDTIMLAAGFVNYRHEWWHFDFGDQLWAVSTGAECAIYGRAKPEFVWLDIS